MDHVRGSWWRWWVVVTVDVVVLLCSVCDAIYVWLINSLHSFFFCSFLFLSVESSGERRIARLVRTRSFANAGQGSLKLRRFSFRLFLILQRGTRETRGARVARSSRSPLRIFSFVFSLPRTRANRPAVSRGFSVFKGGDTVRYAYKGHRTKW